MTATLTLSRLTLNPARRDTWQDLADCQRMHRRLLLAFADLPEVSHAREHYGLLYRVESGSVGQRGHSSGSPMSTQTVGTAGTAGATPLGGRVTILAQSRATPDWSRLPSGYLLATPEVKALDPLYDALYAEMELVFRLQANPTRRIRAGSRAGLGGEVAPESGKRVPLRGVEAQLAWLRRKGEDAGYAVVEARVRSGAWPGSDTAIVSGQRAGTGALTLGSVIFEGRLRITNLVAFRAALEQGIGSGKAYGFGLLSIAPVSRSAPVLR